jgi:hypothetical protein
MGYAGRCTQHTVFFSKRRKNSSLCAEHSADVQRPELPIQYVSWSCGSHARRRGICDPFALWTWRLNYRIIGTTSSGHSVFGCNRVGKICSLKFAAMIKWWSETTNHYEPACSCLLSTRLLGFSKELFDNGDGVLQVINWMSRYVFMLIKRGGQELQAEGRMSL